MIGSPVTVTTDFFSHRLAGNVGAVHVTWTDVIGWVAAFGAVFAGVFVAEYMTRRRERAEKFGEEYFALLEKSVPLFTHFPPAGSPDERFLSNVFMAQLGKLRHAARPPQPNSRAKRREVDHIIDRYDDARDAYRKGGPVPIGHDIFGTRVGELVAPDIAAREAAKEAARAAQQRDGYGTH